MGIKPQIYDRRALIVRISTHLLLLRMARFGMESLFAFSASMDGSSAIAFFPLWWEELSPFIGDMKKRLNGKSDEYGSM